MKFFLHYFFYFVNDRNEMRLHCQVQIWYFAYILLVLTIQLGSFI